MNVIEFAVAETLKAHPYLSRGEVVHLSTEYIENNLPQIVKNANLPNRDLIIRMGEKKLQVIRRSLREAEERKIREKLEVLDALYKIRGPSNGHGEASSADSYMPFAEGSPYTTVIKPVPLPADTRIEKIGDGKYQDSVITRFPIEKGTLEEPEVLKRLGDTRPTERLELLPVFERITEDSNVLSKKNTNEYFGIIIDEVKRIIERLPELQDEHYYAEIFLEHDVELPEWEQTIIKFKIENKSFDEKMKLWDDIDRGVRNLIKDIESGATKKGIDPAVFDKINKNLFIDVELA